MDVVAWLRISGFGQYAASFAENKIDAGVLRQLTNEDLKELGVSALGDRKKLLAAIATLGQSEGTFSGRESSTTASALANPPLTHTRNTWRHGFSTVVAHSRASESMCPHKIPHKVPEGHLMQQASALLELTSALRKR